MRLIVFALVLVLMLGVATVKVATAQQVPNVANLKAFSPETNFMSLPGYLRWLVFQQTGNWISRAEAVRIVNQQAGR